MNLKTENSKDDEIFPTVFTVPINKPWILTKEAGEEIMKKLNEMPPMTREERAEIKKRTEKLFKKPEKKQDG